MPTRISFEEGVRRITLELEDLDLDPAVMVTRADVKLVDANSESQLFYLKSAASEEGAADLANLPDDTLQDRRDAIKQDLKALDDEVKELKAEREDIDDEFKRRFKERNSNGTKTDRYNTFVVTDDKYPVLVDREAFQRFVLETRSLHFLQNRLALSAIQEEIAAGGSVPGVQITRKTTINQRKR